LSTNSGALFNAKSAEIGGWLIGALGRAATLCGITVGLLGPEATGAGAIGNIA
jgi:hypothetical protein